MLAVGRQREAIGRVSSGTCLPAGSSLQPLLSRKPSAGQRADLFTGRGLRGQHDSQAKDARGETAAYAEGFQTCFHMILHCTNVVP